MLNRVNRYSTLISFSFTSILLVLILSACPSSSKLNSIFNRPLAEGLWGYRISIKSNDCKYSKRPGLTATGTFKVLQTDNFLSATFFDDQGNVIGDGNGGIGVRKDGRGPAPMNFNARGVLGLTSTRRLDPILININGETTGIVFNGTFKAETLLDGPNCKRFYPFCKIKGTISASRSSTSLNNFLPPSEEQPHEDGLPVFIYDLDSGTVTTGTLHQKTKR